MFRALRVAATNRYATRSLASKTSRPIKLRKEETSTDEIDQLIDESLAKTEPADSPLLASGSQSPPDTAEGSVEGSQFGLQPTNYNLKQGQGPPLGQASSKPRRGLSPNDYIYQDNHRLSVKSTRNNTHVTFARPNGTIIFRTSGGREGFKGANRASYECGYACATKVLQKVSEVQQEGEISVHLFLNGFRQGREAVYRALVAGDSEGLQKRVVAITDNTPLKIGGTRPKKARRL